MMDSVAGVSPSRSHGRELVMVYSRFKGIGYISSPALITKIIDHSMSHYRTDSTQELLDTTNSSIHRPGHGLSTFHNKPYATIKAESNVSIDDIEYSPYVNFHADLTSTTGVYDLRPTLPPTRPISLGNAIQGASDIAAEGGLKAWTTILGA